VCVYGVHDQHPLIDTTTTRVQWHVPDMSLHVPMAHLLPSSTLLPLATCPASQAGPPSAAGAVQLASKDRPSGVGLLMHFAHGRLLARSVMPWTRSPCPQPAPPAHAQFKTKPESCWPRIFRAAKEPEETLCPNLMPVIPAPAGRPWPSSRSCASRPNANAALPTPRLVQSQSQSQSRSACLPS
jgi:hypothetical protein